MLLFCSGYCLQCFDYDGCQEGHPLSKKCRFSSPSKI